MTTPSTSSVLRSLRAAALIQPLSLSLIRPLCQLLALLLPDLRPGIDEHPVPYASVSWMAGPSPAMTKALSAGRDPRGVPEEGRQVVAEADDALFLLRRSSGPRLRGRARCARERR